MSIIRITDRWLKNSAASEDIRQYLVDSKAVSDAALTFTVDLNGEFATELVVELNDDHPHSDSVENDIHERLILARLDFAHNSLLKSLAWSFSSPAKTDKFREILETKKNNFKNPLTSKVDSSILAASRETSHLIN